MMKNIATICSFIIFIFCGIISAQTHFPQALKYYWVEGTSQNGQNDYHGDSLIISDDSFANGYRYFNSWYKADSQKLWMKNQVDTAYQLVYDFTLNAGDTFKGMGNYEQMVIDSLGSIWMMGKMRKVQYVRAVPMIVGTTPYLTIIEGFGSMQAGLEYWRHFIFESHRNLIGGCYEDSSYAMLPTKVLGPHNIVVISDTRCEEFQMHVQAVKVNYFSKPIAVKAYPNPFHQHLHIKSNEFAKMGLYDALGRLVIQLKADETGVILLNTETWNQGYYFLVQYNNQPQKLNNNIVLLKVFKH